MLNCFWAWVEAERLDDVEAYRRYQQGFPQGLFYVEAGRRIKAFEAQQQFEEGKLISPQPSELEPKDPKSKNTAEAHEGNQAGRDGRKIREPEKTKRPPVSISKGSATLGGKTYQTVRINGLAWMAQNLDYEVPDSWCYDNDPANCRKYGRLYTWEAAKQACAAVGWRLPTDAEWSALRDKYGGEASAYKALIEGGNSGFSVRPPKFIWVRRRVTSNIV